MEETTKPEPVRGRANRELKRLAEEGLLKSNAESGIVYFNTIDPAKLPAELVEAVLPLITKIPLEPLVGFTRSGLGSVSKHLDPLHKHVTALQSLVNKLKGQGLTEKEIKELLKQ